MWEKSNYVVSLINLNESSLFCISVISYTIKLLPISAEWLNIAHLNRVHQIIKRMHGKYLLRCWAEQTEKEKREKIETKRIVQEKKTTNTKHCEERMYLLSIEKREQLILTDSQV